MKILISDKFPTEGLKVFEAAEDLTVDYQPGLSSAQLLEAIVDADALVVRSGTQVNEELFQAARQLKVVGRAGVGTENMDLDAANHKGVVIMHTPFGSTTTTAEHTIAMVMALAACCRGLEGLGLAVAPDLLAIDLQDALDNLGDIVGDTTTEDVLDLIFDSFCIGK